MVLYSPTTITTVSSIFTAIGLCLTALRFWTRLSFARIPLGPEDLFAAAAAVFTAVFFVAQTQMTYRGTSGDHIVDGSAASILEHKMEYCVEIVEKLAGGFVKLSLLFFFRRIFGVCTSFRMINNVMVGVVVVWTVGFLGQALFICGAHPEYMWQADQHIPEARCGNNGAALFSFAVTDFATDLPILIVPLVYVRRLQMGGKQKTAASFVFLLGFISTAASLLRFIFLSVAYPLGRVSWMLSPSIGNAPWVLEVINPVFYMGLELQLGVWAANLLALAPLLRSISFSSFHIVSEIYRKAWGRGKDFNGSRSPTPVESQLVLPRKQPSLESC